MTSVELPMYINLYWMPMRPELRLDLEAALIRRFKPDRNVCSGRNPRRDAEVLASIGLIVPSLPPKRPPGRPRLTEQERAQRRRAREIRGRQLEDWEIILRDYGAVEREPET